MIFKQDLWLNPGDLRIWWTLTSTITLHYPWVHIYFCCSIIFSVWNTIFMHLKLYDFYFTFFSGMGWFERFEVTSSLEDIDVTWKLMMIALWQQMLWTGSISIWRTTQTLALMFQGNVTQGSVRWLILDVTVISWPWLMTEHPKGIISSIKIMIKTAVLILLFYLHAHAIGRYTWTCFKTWRSLT